MSAQKNEIPYYSRTLSRPEVRGILEEKMRAYGFGRSATQKISGQSDAFIWTKTGEQLGQTFDIVVRIDPRKEALAIDKDLQYLSGVFENESKTDLLGNGSHMRIFMGGASQVAIYIQPHSAHE
ncbi:MAG: hypothetical protein DYH13_01970 [Alphaproteobacteria bacterium PRO2]|nr:hypothetical protein [Alphaproteobacteria bacterium PRO2]